MAEGKSLDDLRRDIDAIDDALHDLLMRRASVTDAIARTKPRVDGRIPLARAMRPAREAEIMRRAIARHSGSLPVETVVRVIREVLAASLRAQTPFRAHVLNDDHLVGLAHEYFGAGTPLSRNGDADKIVERCVKDPNVIAVLPIPGSSYPWWKALGKSGGPRVIAKLPFVDRGAEPRAYVLAAIEQEPTGDDTTLVMGDELTEHALAAAGIAARKNQPGLFETDAFVAHDDPRLAKLGAVAIGGYANPVTVRTKELAQ